MLTILAVLAVPAPTDSSDIGWALAYSGYVMRHCDGWDLRLDDVPLAALPNPRTFGNGRWSDTGVETLSYRDGLATARMAQARDPKFCDKPLRAAGKHARQVEQLLERRVVER